MKRYQLILLSFFSAILLSLPWLNILPGWILFVAFLPLLILEDRLLQQKANNKGIVFFGYAYLTFWLWNTFTCWWLVYATPFGVFTVVFLNAIFMATIWWLFHTFKRKFKSRIANIALVSIWLAYEYVHYHWDIEWPWLNLGNGFANQVTLIQWYEYTGVLGGSLWVLVVNIVLFGAYKQFIYSEIKRSTQKLVSAIIIIIIPVSISFWIFSNYEEKGKSVEIVVLQPNIDPYTEKFGSTSGQEQIDRLIALADSLVTDSTDYLVAPETAIQPIWENKQMRDHPYLARFNNLLTKYPKLQIIVGATTKRRFETDEELSETARKSKEGSHYFDVYNSAIQIGTKPDVQTYHKSILVTGVEKMPFSKYFSFLENFIIDLGGTTGSLGIQEEPSIFIGNDSIAIAPVICYESVFGEYISKYIKKKADLIFIMTNDGWWKDTPGYKQHFSFARLRAIEMRRSIARSANTGISALINQRGEVLQKTKWCTKTALKGKIKTNNQLTFYVRYGDYIGRISSFIAVMLLLFLFGQKRILEDKKNPHQSL